MSYEKTVWAKGDTITSEKLNHLEAGVEEAANRPVFAPEIVTGEGDVSVTYDGNQIGVLSASGTLTLNTEGKVVEHDIEVEYTVPSAPTIELPNFSFTDNSSSSGNGIYAGNSFGTITDNELLYVPIGQATKYLPRKIGNNYSYLFSYILNTDNVNITINNESVPYDSTAEPHAYRKPIVSETPQDVTIIINNK